MNPNNKIAEMLGFVPHPNLRAAHGVRHGWVLTDAVGRCLTSAKGGNREPDPYGSRSMSGYGDLGNGDVDYCGDKAIAAGNVFIFDVGTETYARVFGVVWSQEATTTLIFAGPDKCFPYRCTPINFGRSVWVPSGDYLHAASR